MDTFKRPPNDPQFLELSIAEITALYYRWFQYNYPERVLQYLMSLPGEDVQAITGDSAIDGFEADLAKGRPITEKTLVDQSVAPEFRDAISRWLFSKRGHWGRVHPPPEEPSASTLPEEPTPPPPKVPRSGSVPTTEPIQPETTHPPTQPELPQSSLSRRRVGMDTDKLPPQIKAFFEKNPPPAPKK